MRWDAGDAGLWGYELRDDVPARICGIDSGVITIR